MNKNEIKEKINKIGWWHSIDLGDGLVTPGKTKAHELLQQIQLPEDLTGKSVLDIGAWDGFFSFEAEKRGAKRVVAIDIWDEKQGVSKKGFDFAKRVLDSKVEDKVMSAYDISPEIIGEFDIVLFLGVLYHLKYPMLVLEKIFSVAKKLLITETHVDLIGTKQPAMRFYPTNELNNDYSNWWGPNPAAVRTMLREAGFRDIQEISKECTFLRRFGRVCFNKLTKQEHFFEGLNQNRMVFHAYKRSVEQAL